jgi:ABC-2 type transport system ATP-binding protein
MAIIECEGLRKEYRRLRGGTSVALRGLDMSVEEGGVFGFLGPNGSGKTTTIRCLLALSHPTAGRCSLLGVDPQTQLHKVIDKVGSIVEAPAFFGGFSGRRNLQLLARSRGMDLKKVEFALERVGLANRGKDLVKTYSLGMKQRLGIAGALMKDPALLILDEPANGLDPAGIKEVRELIRSLGREGRTVFVSSHVLSEIQQTCDRVAILSRGRAVRIGSVDEVLTSGRSETMLVRLHDLDKGAGVLRAAGIEVQVLDDGLSVSVAQPDASRITEVLASSGIFLSELRPHEVSLEDVFLELTAEEDGGQIA